jgi:hypothetical protein
MQGHILAKFSKWMIAVVSLLLLAAAANAEDTVIQTSLLGAWKASALPSVVPSS